jgi:hypothetical protein
MDTIRITKGDLPKGEWKCTPKSLVSNGISKKVIPIKEIVSIEKLDPNNRAVIGVDLGSGQKFQASMAQRTLSRLQEDFEAEGNKPENIKLPIVDNSNLIVCFSIIGFLLFMMFIKNSDNDDAVSSSETTIRAAESDKAKICERYIAAVMYKSSSTIMRSSLIKKDSAHFFNVNYRRRSDNKLWEYVCHIDDSNVVWAALDHGQLGEFRYDEYSKYKVTKTENGKQASISIPVIGQISFNL